MKKLISLAVLVIYPLFLPAQSIMNIKIQISGDRIIINYDLESVNTDYNFSVIIYSSHDNYAEPLKQVTGDVGMDVKPGGNKKITWEAHEELGDFEGKIALEIRARFYIPFLRLLNPVVNDKWKRGKIHNIEWSGGGSSDIRIDLYRDNQREQTIITAQNTGVFRWNIPIGIKPGKNYQLLLSDSRNTEDQVYSEGFSVTHKIPSLLKGAVVLAAGIVIYLIIPDKTKPEESIPNPPPVPGN